MANGREVILLEAVGVAKQLREYVELVVWLDAQSIAAPELRAMLNAQINSGLASLGETEKRAGAYNRKVNGAGDAR